MMPAANTEPVGTEQRPNSGIDPSSKVLAETWAGAFVINYL
jgi:hypothetical protein